MKEKKKINILIPCCNEEKNIPIIIKEIDKYFNSLNYDYDFIFVDDGSTDNTYNTLLQLIEKRENINVIKLSRNFGKEAAIAAGLRNCNSDAAIIIDSDLEHPPHLIQAMILEWEKGANIVHAVKIKRQKETIINKFMSLTFYKILGFMTDMEFQGASDYKLVDKKTITILNNLTERNRFFRGLTNWMGMKHCRIEFKVEDRRYGKTKWTPLKLFQLSVNAITSYTSKPLHIVTILGLFTLIFSIILALQTLYNKIFGVAISGFTTVILAILIFSSVIMISIGILGVYLSKVYDEVKNRPNYIIEDYQSYKNRSKIDNSINSKV